MMKTIQELQAFYYVNKKEILMLIIRFIRLQKVLGLCDRGQLEEEGKVIKIVYMRLLTVVLCGDRH